MSQGRGSAALLLLLLLSYDHLQVAESATFTVGDAAGWTFNTATWPAGKHFAAGDVLAFNYNPAVHNVVAVNRGGYQSCSTPNGAKVYNSGRDAIKLIKGPNYFICSVPGHCQAGGMKIAINAV